MSFNISRRPRVSRLSLQVPSRLSGRPVRTCEGGHITALIRFRNFPGPGHASRGAGLGRFETKTTCSFPEHGTRASWTGCNELIAGGHVLCSRNLAAGYLFRGRMYIHYVEQPVLVASCFNRCLSAQQKLILRTLLIAASLRAVASFALCYAGLFELIPLLLQHCSTSIDRIKKPKPPRCQGARAFLRASAAVWRASSAADRRSPSV